MNPYATAVRRRLDAFHVGLSCDLGGFAAIPCDVALQALRYLLEVACQAQHVGNITVGRQVLCRAPREWLLAALPDAVGVLDLDGDEWAFRRYVELLSLLDPIRAERAVERGLEAGSADVREAARDQVGACAGFAEAHGASVLDPPW